MNPFHDVMVALSAWYAVSTLCWVALAVAGVYRPALHTPAQWFAAPTVVACGAVVIAVNALNGAFRSSDHNPPRCF